VAQQVLITATPQSETALHQPDRATTKIVDFPGALGDVLVSEQNYRDRAVGVKAAEFCAHLPACGRTFPMSSRLPSWGCNGKEHDHYFDRARTNALR